MLKKGDAAVLTPEQLPGAPEVREALRLILESQPFRTSKQCQDLLRYIVNHSIEGDGTDLRERIIGAEVFHRDPSYDTNEDPVVRVRAADVRKRLAQYYQAVEPGNTPLHIELSPGSYRARFSYQRTARITADSEPVVAIAAAPKPEPRVRWWQLRRVRMVAAGVILSALAIVVIWLRADWRSPQERFWAPVANAKQPVLIYLGANVGYVFSPSFLAAYRAQHGLPDTGVEFFVDLPPGSMVRAEDLMPKRDTFVTTADVTATVQITTMLRDWKRPFVLRTGRDLTFGDLRNRPSVMMGAFNNAWTLELTNDLPFSFRKGLEIFNRDHPARSWSVSPDTGANTIDYALLTRVLSSKTGGPAITVAGIGEFGTLAAAEFLANPDKMRDLLKTAPRGWENKNMQAVLSVKVVDFQPVVADVVATAYW